jgi:hypothetical protein
VSLLSRFDHAFMFASAIAALGLIAGNCALLWHGAGPGREPGRA